MEQGRKLNTKRGFTIKPLNLQLLSFISVNTVTNISELSETIEGQNISKLTFHFESGDGGKTGEYGRSGVGGLAGNSSLITIFSFKPINNEHFIAG